MTINLINEKLKNEVLATLHSYKLDGIKILNLGKGECEVIVTSKGQDFYSLGKTELPTAGSFLLITGDIEIILHAKLL